MNKNVVRIVVVVVSVLGLGLIAHLTNFVGLIRQLHGG